jgi:hypothetical protein
MAKQREKPFIYRRLTWLGVSNLNRQIESHGIANRLS